ncbi:peptidyl-alpha-hydroxyglycine alpha-amidating lyase family protein [Ensifer sp. YR511]|uniref:peptidyl-alpha-hydroxyglycine alpha-amidating lyase family protein n=1 Tax=Ensifer sp. YR511 TaxID=1855294 RepID=UPI00088F3C81|nr:peptidyl-alpha-hydroxyglycine alpha-amidating lyase family protein [Ensifer sp. YR511]SDN73167.1 NHL repeat-containing protein [Ensifer sp. YR511]
MTVGKGSLQYRKVDGWGELPGGVTFDKISGLAVDSRDRVYLFARTPNPVLVFEQDGAFVGSWGAGVFTRAHGIYIDADDNVFCADDKDHTVRQFTTDGRLIRTWGEKGVGSKTGYDGKSPETIVRSAGPFNRPTGIAKSPNGEMFVTDGYGNACVHRFGRGGELLLSWGSPGSGPGQFHSPHCLRIGRDGRVYVLDKENSRLQVFTQTGEHLATWGDLNRPNDIFIDAFDRIHVLESPGQITVFDLNGGIICRWGRDEPFAEDGEHLKRAHTMALDSKGCIYVAGCALDYIVKYEPVGASRSKRSAQTIGLFETL